MVVRPELMACSQSCAESKCTCTSMPPGVAIRPSASRTVVAAPTIRFGMNAVHGRRIAGLADADDLAVLDADVAFDDAEHRIDDQRIAQQHVERAHGAVIARRQAKAVAQRLAAAMQAFLARNGVVVLDLGEERGVAEPDRIARRRAIHMRVVFAAHLGHGLRLP